MEIYIWLGISVIAVLAELATAGLAAIWFAPAALLSMLLAVFRVPVSVQISVFVIVSGLLMIIFYKKVKDNIDRKSEKTNLDALIGKEAVVEEDISYRAGGRVKVGGISWSACISKDSLPAVRGDVVKILSIDGVKLIVEKSEGDTQQEKETVSSAQ